jgi:hypothetical protein
MAEEAAATPAPAPAPAAVEELDPQTALQRVLRRVRLAYSARYMLPRNKP